MIRSVHVPDPVQIKAPPSHNDIPGTWGLISAVHHLQLAAVIQGSVTATDSPIQHCSLARQPACKIDIPGPFRCSLWESNRGTIIKYTCLFPQAAAAADKQAGQTVAESRGQDKGASSTSLQFTNPVSQSEASALLLRV